MQSEETAQILREQIAKQPILLFMKGEPAAPQCGFSARACELLAGIGKPYAYVDILQEPEVRATLPSVSEWPTFPQLFVKGELIGGSDIIAEMVEAGELQPLIEAAVNQSE